jgi:hypothetical protein
MWRRTYRRRRGRRAQLPQPGGELDENLVAGGVAERLVDVADTVDIEHQDGDHVSGGGDLDGVLQRAEHATAVRQAGQRVVVRIETKAIDQPGVLHRHRRLRGNRLEQFDVAVGEGERPHQVTSDLEGSDHGSAGAQRRHDDVPRAGLPQRVPQCRVGRLR